MAVELLKGSWELIGKTTVGIRDEYMNNFNDRFNIHMSTQDCSPNVYYVLIEHSFIEPWGIGETVLNGNRALTRVEEYFVNEILPYKLPVFFTPQEIMEVINLIKGESKSDIIVDVQKLERYQKYMELKEEFDK